MKERRKPEYPEKTPDDALQEVAHTNARKFKPQPRLELALWLWWQAGKADVLTITPGVAPFLQSLCVLVVLPSCSFRVLFRCFVIFLSVSTLPFFCCLWPPRWPNGKAFASRAEDPGFESRLRRDFFGVESYQWLKKWHSSGYPARRLALKGQRWDWVARCQYTVTGWGRTFDLQLLPQCGST